MPDRFEPNRRLLTTLIGSSLYGSPDACIRELIQNSWDAIQWRKKYSDGSGGRIDIRYSTNENWFEITDDGFGMDQKTIKKSFLDIGQDKLSVLGATSRESQIGYFGIGVLSIFLIADRFQVITKQVGSDARAIGFEVTGIEDDVNYFHSEKDSFGTSIRVYPKNSGNFSITAIPEIVRNYVRHVEGVFVSDVDNRTQEAVDDVWTSNDFSHFRYIDDLSGVRSGRFSFSSALKEQSGTLDSEVIICNAGFLTETNVHDLLPTPALGMVGELDLEPHALTMGMSRERIQRDGLWKQLGNDLQEWFLSVILDELQNGEFQHRGSIDTLETKRSLMLWYNFLPPTPPFSKLYDAIDQRIYETVPFMLSERSQSSLSGIFGQEARGTKLFFKQKFQPNERIQTIDDEGMPIHVSEEIRDSVRVGALRAKGYEVIELDRLQVNFRKNGSVQTQWIDEYPLVLKCLQKRGVQLIDIANASDSDMDLRSIEQLPILQDALSIAGGLRFASIPDSKRRTITDYSGVKYINLRNHDVQNLLRIIPPAVSNPLRNRLLEVYLKIEDFRFHDARQILIELLETKDLSTLASVDIAPLTRKHVESLIEELLMELDQ